MSPTANQDAPPELARLRSAWGEGSGPEVAGVFQPLLSLIFLGAFLSLGVQVELLIGSRGLLPLAPLMDRLHTLPGVGPLDFPTLFWLGASDVALLAGVVAGIGLSVAALVGLWPRLCFALLGVLYLSFVTAGQDFLSFQWDNLLVETSLLAVFLPADRRAPWIHLLFRLLLFKLYFESGIAKGQSHLNDWHDGSAMTFYYETAPLPTRFAWFAHQLPEWWHHLESRGTLVLELLVPFAILGPRPARLLALITLTSFQLINLATANYGFFVYLTLVLHVFLLDDRDVRRVRAYWSADGEGARKELRESPAPRARSRWLRAIGIAACVLWISLSLLGAARSFGDFPRLNAASEGLLRRVGPWRVANTYRLFGHITEERVEPEFQTLSGNQWTAHAMHYKPGPLERPPPWVAPHQPRVDFRLWFFGLAYRASTPRYVGQLLDHLCHDPAAVRSLFADPLPPEPTAVRVSFWQYRFTRPDERRETGNYWKRLRVASTAAVPCRKREDSAAEGPLTAP